MENKESPSSPGKAAPSALRSMAKAEGGSTQIAPIIMGSNNTIQLPISINMTQTMMPNTEKSLSHLKSIHREELQRRCASLFEYSSWLVQCKPSTSKNFTEPWLTEGEMGPASHTHEALEAFYQLHQRNSNRTIKLADIFHPRPTEQPESTRIRVVVTKGIAGIGKTVCTDWLVHSWACGSSLTQFDFIFPLPFQKLSLLPAGHLYSLINLLMLYFPHLHCFEQVMASPNRCLFILDGLDECQLPLEFTSCPEHSSVLEPASPACLVVNLIRGSLLPRASVWITSRPVALGCLPSCHIDRITEIQGFLDSQIEEFFNRRLGNCGDKIIAILKKQKTLFNMCYIPAFCWLLAIIFERSPKTTEEECMPKNVTEVYTIFFMLAVAYQHHRSDGNQRSVEDAKDLLWSNSTNIQNLSRMAYNGLRFQKMFFSPQDLEDYNLNGSGLYQGLVKEFVSENNGPFCQKAYSFVHLTVQEYLAALFVLIDCSVPHKRSLFSLHKELCLGRSVPKGLFSAFKKACEDAIQSPVGHLDLFLRFLCGLAMESNQCLLQGLLGDYEEEPSVASQIAKYIHEALEKNLAPERCLNLLHCLGELRDNSLVEKIKDFMANGSLSSRSLSSAEYSALAFVLETSDEALDVFSLNPYVSVPDGLRRLSPVAKLYRSLQLEKGHVNQEVAECIHYILSSYKTQITELRFRYLQLDDSVWEKLWDALRSPNCKVKTLSLKNCKLQVHHLEEIGKMILVNSSITELNLTNNYVGDLGVKHLTALLSRATCNISKLGLANNSLSAACCTDLATLVSSSQALKELSLSKNDFAASGFTIQFSELSQPTCQLEELELFCCGITAQCCEDLAANLHSNHVLKKLVLRNNKLEDRGVEQLCSAFQQPISALRTLQLEGCMLTSKCCAALATVLEKSRSLQHLGLDWNDIGDEGVRQLCQGLQTPGCVLQTLEMESCELTAGCCGELAQTLSSSHSLTCLVLSDNELGDQGVKLLSAGLKHPNCVLQTLVLQENNLTAACCKDLEQALDSSSHLTTLDLSRNLLTDKSVSYLQGLAQSCVSLCTVELRLNKLSRHGKSKLNYPQSWKVSFNI